MKGAVAKVEITITMEYELPYWDKERFELYGESDPNFCVECDLSNMEKDLDDLLVSGQPFLGFPTDDPANVQWAGRIVGKNLIPAIP